MAALADGVAQRVRALELFVRDVYADRRHRAGRRRAGALPRRRPPLRAPPDGQLPEDISSWITVAGLDVVRDSDGSFKVLEDNLRTPSGIAYAVATREVLGAHLPPPRGLRVRSLDAAFQTLGDALVAAAPAASGEHPVVVLLSDGQANSAFYEHATIAGHLGIPLVLLKQLSVRRGRLFAQIDGEQRAVDVLYRRTDEDRLADDHGSPTAIAELLLEPILAGTLACVNAFGTGVADDKLMHAYVEDMVRFYLGQEPLLESVHTYDPTQPGVLEEILARIDELVIKPRTGHGGYGVVIGPHARPEDRAGRGGEAVRGSGALRGPGDDHALAPPHRHRRAPRAAAHRPAPVRHLQRRRRARAAGRPHARGLRPGGARRQLIPERWQQGHVGAGMSAACP